MVFIMAGEKAMYIYRVTHPEHETVVAPAEGRLHAVQAAAKKWGVPWTSVARACDFECLGDYKEFGRKPGARKGAAARKPDPAASERDEPC